jgi:hypothetical protein
MLLPRDAGCGRDARAIPPDSTGPGGGTEIARISRVVFERIVAAQCRVRTYRSKQCKHSTALVVCKGRTRHRAPCSPTTTREDIDSMRMIGIAAVAAAAVMGGSAVTLTAHATQASGGSSTSRGGNGGNSIGGDGLGCGVLSGSLSNDLNNLLGGQIQLLNGVNLLDNVFIPVLSPGARPIQSATAGGSMISNSRGGTVSGSTGNTACGNAGNGGRGGSGGTAKSGGSSPSKHSSKSSKHTSKKKVVVHATSSGGAGGDSVGGSGVLCGVGSGSISNDLNNLLGGQIQLLNGVSVLDNVFVPVLSGRGGATQTSLTGGSTILGGRGGSVGGSVGNTGCGNAGNGGSGGNGGTATSGGHSGHHSHK